MAKATTNRRGMPRSLVVLGVCFVSAVAAVIVAVPVIGVLFFFILPSEGKKQDNVLVQAGPAGDDARPKEKSKPPTDLPDEELPQPPIALPEKVPVTPVNPPALDDFVPLFNGKDLSGWKAGDGQMPFRVDDGNLVGVGALAKVGNNTAAVSEKMIAQDFHLRMEARLGDKGVFYVRFRCPPDSPNGYRLTMLTAKNGIRSPTLSSVTIGKTRSLTSGKVAEIKTNEWFTLEIIAKGNRLELKVDGITAANVVDNDMVAPGHLRFYYLGDCNFVIRKLQIKELTAAPAPPKVRPVVPAPPGDLVALFNGQDLTGWKTHPKHPGNWRVKDGILTCVGPSPSALYTVRDDYRDFHLRVEARINDGGAGGVYARSGFGGVWPTNAPKTPPGFLAWINNTAVGTPKTGVLYVMRENLASGGGTSLPGQAGEWRTIELIAANNTVRLLIDGRETRVHNDKKSLYPQGHIALYLDQPKSVLEFRRIDIKEN